jgi:hypothetical protein
MEPATRRYANPPGGLLPGPARGLPLTLIGYWENGPAGDVEFAGDSPEAWRAWRARSDYKPDWPIVTDFVDELWDAAERDRVASYVEEGLVPWVQMGLSECRFCGELNGSVERTDGVYLWPEGLAHYLREHGVRPPVSVIRHIVASQASMQSEPSEDEDWWKTLNDDEDCADEHDVTRLEWWTARVNEAWWKTATLDS